MNITNLIDFSNFPPQIATIMIAALPVGELNAAMPFALHVLKLPLAQAYWYSVIGNTIPALFILYLLKPFYLFLSKRHKIFYNFFQWLFLRTRNKFNHQYDKHGMWALVLFVAIPVPLAGAWTASLAAWLFDLPKAKSLLFIFLGILFSGVIIGLLNLGVSKVFGL